MAHDYETIQVRMFERNEVGKHTVVHQRCLISTIGTYAMDLYRSETLAARPVAGAFNPDGSQTCVSSTVQEAISRSLAGAEELFAEMVKRGWVTLAPDIEDIVDKSTKQAGFRVVTDGS